MAWTYGGGFTPKAGTGTQTTPGAPRPREMHPATCGDCGKATQVPFKPRADRPVYCRDCFDKHRPARRA